MAEPLTDAEIAQLRASLTPAVLRGMPKLLYRALPRVFEELLERRARDADHVAVMDIAHKDGTAARAWISRVRALLPRIDEAVLIGERGVPLGKNTLELLREVAELLRK